MKNWRKVSAAFGIELPEDQLAHAGAVLDGLEQSFRPLTRQLTFEDDSAAQFNANQTDWEAR